MLGADTMAPGDLLMIGGTSVVHLFQLAEERPVTGFWGPYPHALVDGHWLVEAGQVSAGSVLSWFSREIFALDGTAHDALCEAAARIPVGGSGLLALDYFMGNRTPYRDPHLRGAVLGLSLGHDRAALYHAAVEGVALASANVLKRMDELDVPCRRIVTSGGYSRIRLAEGDGGRDRPTGGTALAGQSDDHRSGGLGRGGRRARARPSRRREGGRAARPDDRARFGSPCPLQGALGDYLEATELLAPLSRRLAARQREKPPA